MKRSSLILLGVVVFGAVGIYLYAHRVPPATPHPFGITEDDPRRDGILLASNTVAGAAYEEPQFQVAVTPYKVDKDLANVANWAGTSI